jgi:SAM-dependent MidA family methyltransferase
LDQLLEKLTTEIQILGAISFARFMDVALYCPVYGYYEKEEDTIGRKGDFYTSVSVGDLFGKLLAVQFADWLEREPEKGTANRQPDLSRQVRVQIIEAGAHKGDLAKDIVRWLREFRPALFERLEYWIVEPSERRRQWQKASLSTFGKTVKWAENFSALSTQKGLVCRIIFCNELLDAMPVHRWGWDAKGEAWFEWGVTLDNQRLVWTRMSPLATSPGLEPPNFPSVALAGLLPDGFTIETCPAATAWWLEAGGVLGSGKLVTIDFGFTREQWKAPERPTSTVRAYRHHHQSFDILAAPGQQDLTAHVDFTNLRNCGESVGLTTQTFQTQSQFLTSIAARIWKGELTFENWTPGHTRQFQTLTHPEHLGHRFHVLVQSR